MMKIRICIITLFLCFCVWVPQVAFAADYDAVETENSTNVQSEARQSDIVCLNDNANKSNADQPTNEAAVLNGTYYIKNKGICWVKRDGYYDFGVAYDTNDSNPQFQWLSYNLDTKKWEIISDFRSGNWVSWKANQGNYWILCKLKTSDSDNCKDEICSCFRYSFDDFSTCIMLQGKNLLLGCASNINNSKYKFQVYNYDTKTWEWESIQNSTWAAWSPHPGTFWINFVLMSSDNRNIGQRTFAYAVPRTSIYHTYTNNTQSSARISIDFPSIDGKFVDDVKFFIWSEKSNRGDIRGFYASNNGFTSYVDIAQGWFSYAGWFVVHIISGDKFIGEYKVCLNESDTAMLLARIRLDQIGWDICNAYNWSAYYPYVSLPLDWSGNQYAQYGLQNCSGNCYAKASSFVYMARQLGYAAHVIFGWVPSRYGGLTPHGWAELYINGQTYVCDPDFQQETGRNGFMISYGQSGTWVYNIGGILD